MRRPDHKVERASLYLGDCLEVIKEIDISGIYAIVADPPYGIRLECNGEDAGGQKGSQVFGKIQGDDEHFDPTPWMELGLDDMILWGCNNYCDKIPPHEGQWYFWDKVTRNSLNVRIAEGEFCWHRRGTKPRAFRHMWCGGYKASETGQKSLHPTQKPVALMRWCLSFLPERCLVIDPYMGSGTTGVACLETGRSFIGIESDEAYFQVAKTRINDYYGGGVIGEMKRKLNLLQRRKRGKN